MSPDDRLDTSFGRLVGLVARRDYLRTVRRRGYILGTLLLPLGIALFMAVSSLVSVSGIGLPPHPSQVSLVVVNESSVRLVNDPQMVAQLDVVPRDAALASLRDGTSSEVYLIPEGYPASGQVTRIETTRAGTALDSVQQHAAQEQALGALLRNSLMVGAGVPPETAIAVIRPVVVVPVTVEGRAVSELGIAASFILPFIFTLLFVMSIFITSGYLLQSVTEEKENRVVEILLSSIPSLPLMAGKVLGLGAAGLTQVVVWLLTAAVALPLLSDRLGSLSDISLTPGVLGLAIAYFVLGYLAFGAIFAAIGALAPGNREAQQYSGFFGFFAVIPLIFAGTFMADGESPIIWLLALFPLTAPATMLQVIALEDPIPWGMVALSLTSLALFVVVATIASARVFRATLLLYGVRPSVRQLMTAVRSPS